MTKYPICFQQNIMDCGVACISMITQYYGAYYSLPELKNLCHPTHEGVSMKAISDTLEQLGFRTVGGRIPIDTLHKAQLPIILHWEQRHFVVLYKIKRKKKKYIFYIGDPACGLLKLSQEEFEEKWISTKRKGTECGIALFILESELKTHKKESHKTSLTRVILPYLLRYKRFFLQLVCGFTLLGAIQIALPYLTKSVVDVGVESGNKHYILLILFAQIVLLGSSTIATMLNNWIILHISTRINLSLVSDFLIKLMRLPMSFFDIQMTGDIVERIGDHKKIESFIVNQLLGSLYAGITGIVFSAILLNYHIGIFMLFLSGSMLYLLWLLLFIKRRKVINYELFKANAKSNAVTYQIVNAMQEAKLQGCTQRRRWEWENAKAHQFEINIKSLKLNQIQEIGSFFIKQATNFIITFLAVIAVINEELTLGTLLAIQFIIGQLSVPINQIINLIYTIQDVHISLERINEIKNKDNENAQCQHISMSEIAEDDINIEHLQYKYEGTSQNILHDINLCFKRNTTTAIVGCSGSGKTTLLKLILQYYSSYEGSIKLGKQELKSLNHDEWRNMCSVVMQESYIFSESIARNIVTSDEEINIERMRKATDIVNISDFIDSLPLKYDTKIGVDGRSLSQGQKQRILLARAIYKNAPFFFLDEATNSLDANNEREILNNLRDFLKEKTAIIVAHRLSTVKDANLIIVLDEGRIVETGTHEELIMRRGYYYKLIKNQLELGK